jgi:hypothetical protein
MEQKHGLVGNLCTLMSWMFTVVKPESIPIVCSLITSILAWVNYYYQIKKNRKNEKGF